MDSAFHNALASGVTGVMVGPGSSNPIGGQFAFIKTYGTNGNIPSTRMGIAGIIREELFNARQYLSNTPADSAEKNFRLESYRTLLP